MENMCKKPIEFDCMKGLDSEMVENIVGKGENTGYQHFLLFPQGFQKASFSGIPKIGREW